MKPSHPLPDIIRTACARIPTPTGEFQLCHYKNDIDNKEHLAIVMGDVAGRDDVLVRVHSECFTGDVLGSMRCDCGEQLHRAMELIAGEACGVIIYLRQEGRGIGLEAKLQAYNLQDEGYDTVEANLLLGHQADEREYWAAAGILADLQVASVRLITNNPAKIEHLTELGVRVVDRVPLHPSINDENAFYLDTKIKRMRHMLDLHAGAGVGQDEESDSVADGPPATLAPSDAARLERLHGIAYTHFHQTGRPFITLSYAQSLDGSISRVRGETTAISGQESLVVTHGLRAIHGAILVGVGTVLADDPRLDVRLVAGPNPAVVILDSHLRTPPTARLFSCHDRVWIITTAAASSDAAARLEAQGATLLCVPADGAGRPDLAFALPLLAEAGIASIMVEGGARVISTFLTQGLADYAAITIAPRFLAGLPALSKAGDMPPLPALGEVTYSQAGDDLIVWGVVDKHLLPQTDSSPATRSINS
jgi:GTP cyclohydrolase II